MEGLTLSIALMAGLLSFLSPCVLPLVPVYVASLTGASSTIPASRRTTFLQALSFVIGFSLVFTALGASVGLLGVIAPASALRRIAGTLLILFGLFLVFARRLYWLNYEARLRGSFKATGYLRPFLIGTFFALGWTPCVGPILGGVLTLASSSRTAWQGACLLLAYCAGLGIPFLIVSLALGAATPLIRWFNRHGGIITAVSGLLLIAVGIAMLTGRLAYLTP